MWKVLEESTDKAEYLILVNQRVMLEFLPSAAGTSGRTGISSLYEEVFPEFDTNGPH